MLGGFGSSTSAGLASGGTVDGDLVVTGDFKVEGAGSFAFDEIVEGTMQVVSTSTAELRIQDGTGKKLRIKQQNNGAFLTAETGNSITFTTNGNTEAMHIDTSQRVGIGTSSPLALLSVGDSLTSTSTPAIVINDVASYRAEFGYSEGGNTRMWLNNSYANNDATMEFRMNGLAYMTLKGDGKVGIGTTSPSTKLHIEDSEPVTRITSTNHGDGAGSLEFWKQTNSPAVNDQIGNIRFMFPDSGGGYSYNASIQAYAEDVTAGGEDASLRFGVIENGTLAERMRLQGSNLGIGTTSPTKPLHVSQTGTGDLARFESTGESFSIQFMADDSGTPVNYQMTHNGNKFIHYNGGNVVHASLKTGEVGIGTDSPSDKLHIADTGTDSDGRIKSSSQNVTSSIGSAEGDNRYFTAGAGLEIMTNTNHDIRFGTNVTSGNATPKMVLDTSGRLGIGTTSPSAKLEVQPNNSDLTSESALGLYIKGNNAGIKMNRHDGGGYTHLYTDIATRDFLHVKTNGDNDGGIATDRIGSITQNPMNNNIHFDGYNKVFSRLGTEQMKHDQYGVNVSADLLIPVNASNTSHKLKITGSSTSEIYAQNYDVYWSTSLNHVLISRDGFYHRSSDSSKIISFRHDVNSIHQIDSNMNDFKMLAGSHTGGFGFRTSGSTGTYLAIQPIYTDNNASGLKFNTKTGGTDTERARFNSSGNFYHQKNVYLGTLDGTYTNQHTSLSLYHGVAGYTATINYLKSGIGLVSEIKAYEYELALKSYEVNRDITFYTSATSNNPVLRMRIDENSRISLSNNDSGTDNTVFGYSAGNNIASGGINNSFFGDYAGHSNTTGDDNTYIGKSAGQANSGTGSNNTYVGSHSGYQQTGASNNSSVGSSSLQNITSGGDNSVLGYKAGYTMTTGNKNVAVGLYSMYSTLDGIRNTAMGDSSMYSNTSGSRNTAIGRLTSYYNQTGSYNVALGNQAMVGVSGNSHSNNIAIGYQSMVAVTTGSYNLAIGSNALDAMTTGSSNVGVGTNALGAMINGVGNVVMGENSGASLTSEQANTYIGHNTGRFLDDGASNVAIGYLSMSGTSGTSSNNALYNVAVGRNSLQNITTGDDNIAIGYQSSQSLTTSSENVAIGSQSMKSATTGNKNIAIGYQSQLYNSTGAHNTSIGYEALEGSSGNSHNHNTAIGVEVLKALSTGAQNVAVGNYAGRNISTGTDMVAVGYNALNSATGATGSIGVGRDAGKGLTTGIYNIAIGHNAMSGGSGADNFGVAVGFEAMRYANSGNSVAIGGYALQDATSDGNVAVGYQALQENTSGLNDALGNQALKNITTGTQNIAIGRSAMTAVTTADRNMAIGVGAMGGIPANQAIVNNIAIGNNALNGSSSSDVNVYNNVSIGYQSMYAITTGSNNTMIGSRAGSSIQNGSANVGIGSDSLYSITSGGLNVAVGAYSGDALTVGGSNVLLGHYAGSAMVEDTQCVAIGKNALLQSNGGGSDGTATATNNTAIGFSAGDAVTTGVNNIFLGSGADISGGAGVSQIVIGTGLTGTANTRVHIGNGTSHIYNDYNTNATWTHSSDERQKKEIKDDTLGLEFINDIRPVTYKHKSPSEFPKEWNAYDENDKEPMGGDKVIHGLIAQEVKQALDKQGVDTFSGWDVNPDGRQQVSFEAFVLPLIKAVQELSAEVNELKQQLKDK